MEDMNPDEAKIKNIIYMAFGFSAMNRVFKPGERKKIMSELEVRVPQIASSKDKQEFQKQHNEFCCWFENTIKTAGRKKNGKLIKKSGPASYGHGAKVLDVSLHVYAYYCQMPNPKAAKRITEWLHSAIDTEMMRHLKKGLKEGDAVNATYIGEVDKDTYAKLQKLVSEDIECKFPKGTLPVQWDDIMWRKLNKKDEIHNHHRKRP